MLRSKRNPEVPVALENEANRVIIPALEKAKIPWLGWHALRRGIVTTLWGLDVPLQVTALVIRHRSTRVTEEHYLKLNKQQEIVQAMQKVEAVVVAKIGNSHPIWAGLDVNRLGG